MKTTIAANPRMSACNQSSRPPDKKMLEAGAAEE
jgi:hypothetical protein